MLAVALSVAILSIPVSGPVDGERGKAGKIGSVSEGGAGGDTGAGDTGAGDTGAGKGGTGTSVGGGSGSNGSGGRTSDTTPGDTGGTGDGGGDPVSAVKGVKLGGLLADFTQELGDPLRTDEGFFSFPGSGLQAGILPNLSLEDACVYLEVQLNDDLRGSEDKVFDYLPTDAGKVSERHLGPDLVVLYHSNALARLFPAVMFQGRKGSLENGTFEVWYQLDREGVFGRAKISLGENR